MGVIMADLNALIAQGAQFAKPVNPFEQYSQLQQLQANQLKVQEAQAAAEERNALRQLNPNSPDYEAQLFKVNPQLGIAYRKEAATTAAQKAAQAKSEFELKAKQREFGDAMKRNLSANPSNENVIAWGQDAVQQGIYEPEVVQAEVENLLKMTPQDRAQLLRQSGATAGELRPTTQIVDQSGQRQVIQIPAFGGTPTTVGTYQDVPLPANVEAQKAKLAKAGATTVNVSTEKAYGGAVAAGAAKEDLALVERARLLPQEFTKIDETLNVLKTSDLNTGLGADLFTVLDKARAQVAADKKAGTRAVNTEYLDALLGSAVFPQIQALGIGARGMDTPAEREFLRKVMTGSITLNKDTLIKMTELRRKGLENEAAQFNKRVEAGEFEPFSQAARRKVEKVEVPVSMSAPAELDKRKAGLASIFGGAKP